MLLRQLVEEDISKPILTTIAEKIKKGGSFRATINGIDGTARYYLIALLARLCPFPVLVVTAGSNKADECQGALQSFFPGQVEMVPPREMFMNTKILARSTQDTSRRVSFMSAMIRQNAGLFVTTGAALYQKTIPPQAWGEMIQNIIVGDSIEREQLLELLLDAGYERVPLVEQAGQFSARGSLIDIFPPPNKFPYRLELFDDHVESVRLFDPVTQRSKCKIKKASIVPARELILPGALYRKKEKLVRDMMERTTAELSGRGQTEAARKLKDSVREHLERIAQPGGLDALPSYLEYFYDLGASLLDYLPSSSLVILDEPEDTVTKGNALHNEINECYKAAMLEGDALAPRNELLWPADQLLERHKAPMLGLTLFPGNPVIFRSAPVFSLETSSVPNYHGQWQVAMNDLDNWFDKGYRVYLAASTEERAAKLAEHLQSRQSSASDPAGANCRPHLQFLAAPGLQEGMIVPSFNLAVVTEQDLLPKRKKKRRLAPKEGIRFGSYRDLSIGDYVVHEQHGIGRYQGLSTMEVGGVKKDYLLLQYRGADKLYIPIDQVALIRKYAGGDGPAPRLHSLGGGEWQRLKNRVKNSVEQLARELLELYAARQAVPGYGYGPDHPWQQEFEARFPYEETPDQLRAIDDVKADLQKSHPMDRLVCGDVGYGKTEVAMRAAFKVVMEGKQVALLVPTTILAQQHLRTFKERLEDFPVKVAHLSRFVSAAEQREIITAIAAGGVDIVIGTHRALSADVQFKDLGLLIIDEEHRFGVRHKEKMKQMRLNVDTLSMTATPIPRTLHLSLSGARDLSIIDTPPENRYPIQTYVLEYSENMVQEALERELKRQGQVYIVYNRIDRIEAYARRVRELIPGARVAVGHGRMPEKALEQIMADFQAGVYQVLVCTTIIESGLDIPNVNTIIVCEADRLGLAQLYQVRGRVGRSDRLAYAYLTYRGDKIVSETARRRLRAVREFTDLGSGFKIALQDLEIRGAGNILGAEQHGFITAVGYDLYCKLLDRAVAALKNERRVERTEPRLELCLDAYIPSEYIGVQAQKIEFYQRIYDAVNAVEVEEIKAELIDRFGSPPVPVLNLLLAGELRILARDLGIERLVQGEVTRLVFRPGKNPGCLERTSAANSAMANLEISKGKSGEIMIRSAGGGITGGQELLSFLKNMNNSAEGTPLAVKR